MGGFSGDGAGALSAQLAIPRSLAVDGVGDLFFADDGNGRVRQITGAPAGWRVITPPAVYTFPVIVINTVATPTTITTVTTSGGGSGGSGGSNTQSPPAAHQEPELGEAPVTSRRQATSERLAIVGLASRGHTIEVKLRCAARVGPCRHVSVTVFTLARRGHPARVLSTGSVSLAEGQTATVALPVTHTPRTYLVPIRVQAFMIGSSPVSSTATHRFVVGAAQPSATQTDRGARQ
jgi:hypothetical protein